MIKLIQESLLGVTDLNIVPDIAEYCLPFRLKITYHIGMRAPRTKFSPRQPEFLGSPFSLRRTSQFRATEKLRDGRVLWPPFSLNAITEPYRREKTSAPKLFMDHFFENRDDGD